MRRVILIHPYYNYYESYPLGLAYLSAVLKQQRKCDVQVIDCSAPFNRLTDNDVYSMIKNFKPDIIGIYINVYQALNAYKLAALAKNFGVPIIAGGPHVCAVPEEVLGKGFDIAVKGEAEETIIDILDWLDGLKRVDSIPGIFFKDGGKILATRERKGPSDLSLLPLPDHDQFPLSHYYSSAQQVKKEFYFKISSSRGCPFSCIFCALVGGHTFRAKKSSLVVEEIRHYVDKYGIKYLTFIDPAFTVSRQRVHELFDLLIAEPKIKIKCCIDTRVDMVDRNLLQKMAAAGCTGIIYGVESGSDETLKKIHKGFTLNQVNHALEWTQSLGISVSINSIVGFPWEKKSHIEDTKRILRSYAKKLNLVPTYNVPIPYSGTLLYDEYHKQYGFTNWWLDSSYSYNIKPINGRTPYFFRATPYLDHFMLKKNFFNYSPLFSQYIYRTLIGNCLYIKRESEGWLRTYFLFLIGNLSLCLCNINPKLEYICVSWLESESLRSFRRFINCLSLFIKNLFHSAGSRNKK